MSIIITINAGMIPAEHWTQDPEIGGGRIIGEACHFIDLARYLLGAPILDVHANAMTGGDGSLGDCVAIELSFEDGSIATVHYLANGNKSYPKERIEVFAGGTIAVIDNFRRTKVIGGSGKLKTRAQDKGHRGSVEAFLKTVEETGDWPIPWEQLLEVTRTTIQADEQIRMQLAKPSTRISDS